MLFITNRVFEEGPTTDPGRKVTFDVSDGNALQSVFFCERLEDQTNIELGSVEFLNRLRASDADQILLYIHGFNNHPDHDIFPRAQALGALFSQANLNIEVVPVIWPCNNSEKVVTEYFDDQVSADASSTAFSRALSKFLAWQASNPNVTDPCLKRINILAHSMGNRVLRGALNDWSRALSGQIPFIFRNIFMAAADVVNETLECDQDGLFICQSSRNVVVYFASDDLALRSSKIANIKNAIASRRLGHTGPEDLGGTPKNVYAVDCDDFNTDYDRPVGHTYFLYDSQNTAGAVFRHIAQCLKTGRVPVSDDNRTLILTDGWPG